MPTLRVPILWVVIAGVHACAAAYAWHMLPHGFSAGNPRFWTNEVLPFVLVATSVACMIGPWRPAAIAVLVAMYVAMAPAWIVVFPVTGGRPAIAAAVIAALLGGCAFVSLRKPPRRQLAIGAALGLAIGIVVPWSQRGGEPGTHPAEPVGPLAPPVSASELPSWIRVHPEAESLSIDAAPLRIALHPVLTFWSRSPDRGWTLLAGDTGSHREPSVLGVSFGDDVLHVDARTLLATAVYSHLNTFCVIEIAGHHHLSLGFSPAPDKPIDVTYSEYPTGRPERFAYVDDAGELHVVEAESGEKGPFTELAHGPLPRGSALGITLFDDGVPIARIDLADFAAQASTQPSPTAGWGVPENALEFSLASDRPDAPATIYVTLAGTSVGRGWDSVGHAAGIYRNRIDLRRHAR